jgi:dTDP-4-amino-4,6-dideoxygalactose transaminase
VINFNRPYTTGREFAYISQTIANLHLSGNGPFSERCAAWFQGRTGCERAFLTPSGTAALEMAGILSGLEPGDEVIMPSFTFVTTASSIALRGAVPVFIDIRPDTLNLDEEQIEAAITPRTRAILPVHYAGMACEMDRILDVARTHDLLVIEDAAQGIMSSLGDRDLGSFGALATVSFHETKNLMCGEGGAVLVNDPKLVERAEIVQEKGTDRSKFLRGEIEKYSWVELGSSYLMSEVNAAFLWAQLEAADHITRARHAIWGRYHEAFESPEEEGLLRRPVVLEGVRHNAHMYYLLLPDRQRRDAVIEHLAEQGIQAVFHYVPLHSAPAGRRYGRTGGPLPITDDASQRLLRLPLWVGMGDIEIGQVVTGVMEACKTSVPVRP